MFHKGTSDVSQPPDGTRLGRQQEACGFSQPMRPIALCSHLCRQVGVLLAGSVVHGKTVFVQRHCTQNEQLKLARVARLKTLVASATAELHM